MGSPSSTPPRLFVDRSAAARRQTGESTFLWWLHLPVLALVLLAAAHNYAPEWTHARLRGEQGLIERTQFVSIFLASLLGFRMLRLPAVRANGWLGIWILCATVGSAYVAGEEISWGQHLFGWSTPEMVGRVNEQNETNLHNISVWLNGVPQTILEIGVFIGGILIPLAATQRPAIRSSRFAVILPSLRSLPCAAIAIAVRITKNIQVHILGGEFPLSARGGEIAELFLYLFILLYLVELRARLLEAPHLPSLGTARCV
jgi:hypothetical protein